MVREGPSVTAGPNGDVAHKSEMTQLRRLAMLIGTMPLDAGTVAYP